MSLVSEHLQRWGKAFEVINHPQCYTSAEEARALGVDAGDVVKTVAVRAASGYALVAVPASRRLDMHLVRQAVGDNHARLATEDELRRDFPDYELGALPPLGSLLGLPLYLDPEVLEHDAVVFAAGSQTESVKLRATELADHERATVTPLARRPEPEVRA